MSRRDMVGFSHCARSTHPASFSQFRALDNPPKNAGLTDFRDPTTIAGPLAETPARIAPGQPTHMTNTALENKPVFSPAAGLAWAVAAAATAWSFWPTLLALKHKWLHDAG